MVCLKDFRKTELMGVGCCLYLYPVNYPVGRWVGGCVCLVGVQPQEGHTECFGPVLIFPSLPLFFSICFTLEWRLVELFLDLRVAVITWIK